MSRLDELIVELCNLPSRHFTSVMSVTHFSSGFSDLKFRFIRSLDFLASLPALVILFGFLLGLYG